MSGLSVLHQEEKNPPMDERARIFLGVKLADDELRMVAGSQAGYLGTGYVGNGLNIGQLGIGACDICGYGGGFVAVSNAVGPFISAFNNITINNGVA